MPKGSRVVQVEAIEKLIDCLPKGTTLYTILRSVSKSGMMRHISVIKIVLREDGSGFDHIHLGHLVGAALDLPIFDHGDWTVKVHGAGQDMGFHLIYELSCVLFNGDGDALKQEWL